MSTEIILLYSDLVKLDWVSYTWAFNLQYSLLLKSDNNKLTAVSKTLSLNLVQCPCQLQSILGIELTSVVGWSAWNLQSRISFLQSLLSSWGSGYKANLALPWFGFIGMSWVFNCQYVLLKSEFCPCQLETILAIESGGHWQLTSWGLGARLTASLYST